MFQRFDKFPKISRDLAKSLKIGGSFRHVYWTHFREIFRMIISFLFNV